MPIVDVETNVDDERLRRRFARAVSTWMSAQGVPLSHCIIRYRSVAASDVFSGPFLLAAPPQGGPGERAFAFVMCRVAHARDREFRTGLARVVARALAGHVDPDLLFVECRPVDPEDHYVGRLLLDPEEVQA